MKIFIVQGSVTDYDLSREWVVRAFTDREKAIAFIQTLNEAVALSRTIAKLDPYMSNEIGEPYYFFDETELEGV